MSRLGNLASRVLVAVIAVPILLFIIYQENPDWTWGLAFAASLVMMSEYFAMTLPDKADRIASTLFGAAAIVALYWLPPKYAPGMVSMVLAVLPAMLYYLFRFGAIETVASRVASSITGVIYAGILFTFVALIKRDAGPAGGDMIVLLLATAWLSDTGGYFAGKAFGRRKLYPAVSPNKTWAGAVGGTLCVAAGAAVIKIYLLEELSWEVVMAMAIPGSILGQLGDLCESLIKRSRGVKDSGTLLPGHGGILDRVDAVLFIAPYFYLVRLFVG